MGQLDIEHMAMVAMDPLRILEAMVAMDPLRMEVDMSLKPRLNRFVLPKVRGDLMLQI